MAEPPTGELGSVLRAAHPRVVATLTRVLRDLDLAEDATQEATVKALADWPKNGLPREPVAWLVTVGRNFAFDQLRRARRQVSSEDAPEAVLQTSDEAGEDSRQLDAYGDDLLRLVCACCHPELTEDSQVVLTLKVVLGFSVTQIAADLLSSPASVERRISRAKQKLAAVGAAGSDSTTPRLRELPERLTGVMRVIYLLFNVGYTRASDPEEARFGLMDHAIRLARITARLFRDHPDIRSLLALMLLTSARAPARTDAAGRFVPLEAQDRARWDRMRIEEGTALLDTITLRRHPPSAYQIQAAISALHCQAQSTAHTDWPQIIGLYEQLEKYDGSPAVVINRAVAMAMSGDDLGSLRLLNRVAEDMRLASYQPYYAAAAFVSRRLGRAREAAEHYERAIRLSETEAERAYLAEQLQAVRV